MARHVLWVERRQGSGQGNCTMRMTLKRTLENKEESFSLLADEKLLGAKSTYLTSIGQLCIEHFCVRLCAIGTENVIASNTGPVPVVIQLSPSGETD